MSSTAAPLTLPLGINVPKEEKQLWVLTYRQRTNPHPMVKNFNASGTLRDVIGRCKEHCDRMNLVFIRTEPFLASLEEDERRNQIGS